MKRFANKPQAKSRLIPSKLFETEECRVFHAAQRVIIAVCPRCGKNMKIIAIILNPEERKRILWVSKESIFSDLNNPDVCTMLSNAYQDKFGFLEGE